MEANQPSTTAAVVQDKAQGMSQALGRAPAGDPSTKPVVVTADAPKPDPTKPAAPAAAAPAAADPAADAVKDPTRGILKGIQAERQKRQAAEQRAADYERRIAELEGRETTAPQVTAPQVDARTENRLLTISEQSARAAHADYQEKFNAFLEAAVDAEGRPTDLYLSVMDRSDHPGEAAYQAGKTLLLQKKYGSDPDGMIKAVREETIKEERERLKAEVTAELTGKVITKQSTPTDILAGGAAGHGGAGKEAPVGFGQLLAKRRR
jgi:hypothetical protein